MNQYQAKARKKILMTIIVMIIYLNLYFYLLTVAHKQESHIQNPENCFKCYKSITESMTLWPEKT